MPDEKSGKEKGKTCPSCGHASPPGSTRCEKCFKPLSQSKVRRQRKARKRDSSRRHREKDELMKLDGVKEAEAKALRQAGYHSIQDISQADPEKLSRVEGIGEGLATKIILQATETDFPRDSPLADWLLGEEEDLSSWLSGEGKAPPEAEAMAEQQLDVNDSLYKWLSGEEMTIDSWLEESALPAEDYREEMGPQEMLAREAEVIQLRETLREKLRLLESGEFDPAATVEELAKAKAELETEKGARRRVEDELENVKRGSLAVIKFVKSQQGAGADYEAVTDKLAMEMAMRENLELRIMQLEEVIASLRERVEGKLADLAPDAQELARRDAILAERQAEMDALGKQLMAKEEALSKGLLDQGKDLAALEQTVSIEKARELEGKIADLEVKLRGAEVDLKHKDELLSIAGTGGGSVDPEVMKKLEEVQTLERQLVVREQEAQRLRDDLRLRDEEMKKLKEPMAYKEQEMLRREEDLMYREKLLQEELKKATQMKAELGSTEELTLKKRLEELQAEVTAKEEEIRTKEKYLSAKEEELRIREQGVITEEVERRETERLMEFKQEKVKTGTARLDDLLLGGIPFGSNVMVFGPPFTGKEVLINAFVADGLKKGVPAVWLLTEKSPKDIRDEMMYVLSGYEEYEKLGLVRYVDAYSRSMGDETQDQYTEYIESPTDYESIQRAVEKIAKEFMEKHKYYRLAFRSVSTLIAYLDAGTVFRFLSPIVGRRKRDKAVSMYTLEKGVHGEQEIQMLGSLMDGMIEFKVENLNTFLAVRGISEVQSRAFIRYSASKSAVTIGSFSLDHIR